VGTFLRHNVHRATKKLCKIPFANLRISTSFDNFWKKDGEEAKIV